MDRGMYRDLCSIKAAKSRNGARLMNGNIFYELICVVFWTKNIS